MTTDTRNGKHRYQVAYLLSEDEALVNIVVSKDNQTTFDPAVDETAAHYMKMVLKRFAV